MKHRILGEPGTRVLLMGNEAIARGTIEAGIRVVVGYPGTPSSEVIETLAPLSRELGMYVEWAVNEKVAFEIALGASFAGTRSMATMKAPGINVASDSILSAAYSGTNAACIIYVADDPGPHTTQTEQDSRWYADLAKLPLIEPSTPQEAKDFVKIGAKLSEELSLPVILRTTTRVSHTTGDVVLGEIERAPPRKGFEKDVERFVRASMRGNLERHRWLNSVLSRAEEVATKLGLNKVFGEGKLAIVTSGVTYCYVREALKRLRADGRARVVKLELLYPFPRNFVLRALEGVDRVLVIEELDPYIETKLRALLNEERMGIEVLGKSFGVPSEGELSLEKVVAIVAKALGVGVPTVASNIEIELPPRPPPMCPGCPHRFSYIAILKGIERAGYSRDEVPIMGDIGCYALSYQPPLEAIWSEHAMGASIGLAIGLKVGGFDKPVIATIGDSTFYHAGIPPLIEAVHKGIDILVVILDNNVVAMTGHQSTPAWSRTESGREAKPVDLVDIVKSVGVEHVAVVDPRDLDKAIETVAKFLRLKGPRVIVFRAPCALMEVRKRGKLGPTPQLDLAKCRSCLQCILQTACPAMSVTTVDGKPVPRIDEVLCVGCGLCTAICPFNALKRQTESG